MKIGWFELRPNDQILALDPNASDQSTVHLEPADVQRVERIFEFIGSDAGYWRLIQWVNEKVDAELDIEDFIMMPEYANERERAFAEIEGLAP